MGKNLQFVILVGLLFNTIILYGQNDVCSTDSTDTGDALEVVSTILSSLQENTTSHYRVKLTASDGVSYGNKQTFTTLTSIGPGGVSIPNLWLKANEGATSSGSILTGWVDQTGTNTFSVYGTPGLRENVINFNPVVNFDNSGSPLNQLPVHRLEGNVQINGVEAFAVYKNTTNNSSGSVFCSTIAGASYPRGFFLGNNSQFVTVADGVQQNTYPYAQGATFHISNIDVSSSVAPFSQVRINGSSTSVTAATGDFSNVPITPLIGGVVNAPGSFYTHFNGELAELVLYSSALTASEKIQIESYLALKYGITIDSSVGNYTSSSGAILWNNTSYWNDIFGIGKDDKSGLNQTQSNSINIGSGDGTGQTGKGNIVLSNPSSLDDGDFLMIGHDNASLNVQSSDLPIGLGLNRLSREWKVKTTNDPGTITLDFNIDGLSSNITGASDFKLLIDTDGDGDFTTGTVTQINASIFSNNRVVFSSVPLPDGVVFTIALNRIFIDVKDDIHQTVKGVSANGNLFYNDYLVNPKVVAAQHYDSGGALVSLPIGSSTQVYDSSGKLAGQVRINEDGSYGYTPATNYTGTVYLTYTAQDSSLAIAKAGITIKVLDVYNGSNNSPVAQVDASSTSINTTINSTVLANDSDVDGDVLTVNSSIGLGSAVPIEGIDLTGAQVNAGSLTLNSNGTYSFAPSTDFVGYTLPVPYTISDGKGGEDSAYIRISVFPNTNPYYYTTDDAKAGGRGVTINGDVTLNDFVNGVTNVQVVSFYLNGQSNAIGTPFSISNVGVITINADGTYVFVPDASYFGNQKIEISLKDSNDSFYNSTLYLTTLVGPFADVRDDINQTIKGVSVNGSLLYNDYFGGNSTVSGAQAYDSSGVLVNLTLGVANTVYDAQRNLAGNITINSGGGYSYTPDVNYVGTLALKYTAKDDNLGVGTAGLTIKVLENYKIVNNPPVAQNDASSTTENTTINSTVLPNDSDVDGDPLSLLSSDIPLGASTTIKGYDLTGAEVNAGALTLNSDGSYVFVPVLNFQGITKAVNYTLKDGKGGTDIAYLIISVYPSNFSVNYYLTDDAKTGKQNNSISGNIKDNDFQNGVTGIVLGEAYENGNPLNIGVANTISGVGVLTLNSNGSYQFIPTPTFSGTVRVELRTNVSNSNIRNSTLYLTVLPNFVCYKPGITTGTALDSKEGITSLGRADQNNSSWPAVRKGAWLVLESKTKGFVINRLSDTQISNIPTTDLVEGMMVYNISKDCLQINVDGTASGWKCFNTQACPD